MNRHKEKVDARVNHSHVGYVDINLSYSEDDAPDTFCFCLSVGLSLPVLFCRLLFIFLITVSRLSLVVKKVYKMKLWNL